MPARSRMDAAKTMDAARTVNLNFMPASPFKKECTGLMLPDCYLRILFRSHEKPLSLICAIIQSTAKTGGSGLTVCGSTQKFTERRSELVDPIRSPVGIPQFGTLPPQAVSGFGKFALFNGQAGA